MWRHTVRTGALRDTRCSQSKELSQLAEIWMFDDREALEAEQKEAEEKAKARQPLP